MTQYDHGLYKNMRLSPSFCAIANIFVIILDHHETTLKEVSLLTLINLRHSGKGDIGCTFSL
ncbi:hypothetical protein DB330_04820 [Lacticaseibacillus casei]|uniref:Uncharacterized protein n=1 Tax=Lacticaseibacillus parahuelsenbergensis TaxID=3068305 RepID=A0ABY9L1N9_9LACO|nr:MULTISPECIES: hypothetical protein [Lacticaseibacillus]MBI6597374.1 hypothetical protein [Lacticaseibacillus casei]MCK2080720.1 hypothetical protein [Lacticaseibacillus casei]MDE3283573.1 hypothetical protein [Lacticaseibacillus casei]MED7630258.1 hypothetical protein [Lacticaseibacillus casei]PTU97037.1 hypothetical protein DB330_04820 [Lacticaseibacillus casei]